MGFFYGEKYSPANRTFLRETGENFIEGTGHEHHFMSFWDSNFGILLKTNGLLN